MRAAAGKEERVIADACTCSESPSIGWHKVTLIARCDRLPANSAVESSVLPCLAPTATSPMPLLTPKARRSHWCLSMTRDATLFRTRLRSRRSSAMQLQLIKAVAAKNPNTVVVLNTGTPFIVKEWINDPNVKAVLNMWQSGQEGGTATARLLLGQANPSGHVTITWPKDNTDTIEGYSQLRGLYPGDTAGISSGTRTGTVKIHRHNPRESTQAIDITITSRVPVQFPFGYGLSYTTFKFSDLKVESEGGRHVRQ